MGWRFLIFIVNCLLISWVVDRLQKAQARVRGLEAAAARNWSVWSRNEPPSWGWRTRPRPVFSRRRQPRRRSCRPCSKLRRRLAIWITRDPSYRTVQANRLATDWMRIPEGANSSKSAPSLLGFEIFDKDGLPVANEELPLRRAAGGEEVTDYEFDWRFANGERRYLYGNAAPLRDADGNVAGGVAAFIDITERKRAEAALRESAEWLKLSQQVAKIGVFEWNIQTGVNTWTPELEAMYGLVPGEFGRTQDAWERLVHPDDRAAAIEACNWTLQTGEPVEREWRVLWRDGSVRSILGDSKALRTPSESHCASQA